MLETTDHAALIAARLKARKAEDERTKLAIRLACSLGAMLAPTAFAQNGPSIYSERV